MMYFDLVMLGRLILKLLNFHVLMTMLMQVTTRATVLAERKLEKVQTSMI